MTEQAEAIFRKLMLLEPPRHTRAVAHSCFASVRRAVPVDVINRQELCSRLSAAGALVTIGVQEFSTKVFTFLLGPFSEQRLVRLSPSSVPLGRLGSMFLSRTLRPLSALLWVSLLVGSGSVCEDLPVRLVVSRVVSTLCFSDFHEVNYSSVTEFRHEQASSGWEEHSEQSEHAPPLAVSTRWNQGALHARHTVAIFPGDVL